jgi:hypothetical protein
VRAELALLLVLVLARPPLLVGGTPAETVARRVLQALVDGDVAAVQEHLTPAGDALDLALGEAVIAATEARIEHAAITSTRIENGRAEVEARLRVGGRSLTTTLHLELRRDGPWPRPTWQLAPLTLPTVQVAIPVGTTQLRVNGQTLTVPAEHRPRGTAGLGIITLRVLPGLYEIGTPPRGSALDPVPARVNVPPLLSPWTSTPLQAGYALTDTGHEQLTALLESELARCLASTSAAPAGCPFAAPSAAPVPGTTSSDTPPPTATPPDAARHGTWELITPPEMWVGGGWMGTYDVLVHGGTARFTSPVGPEGGQVRSVEVRLDARAVGTLDREGQLVTSWHG